jgi:hypothetical protein
MSAPHVVARGRRRNGASMITETRHRGIAIAEDANLTASLYRQDMGTPIQVGLFGSVAVAMRRSGVLDGGWENGQHEELGAGMDLSLAQVAVAAVALDQGPVNIMARVRRKPGNVNTDEWETK